CGAPVQFRWSSAVQTTCEFCRSILVRHDVNLEKVGEVADLPPDPSPIQLGTEGAFNNKPFVVIGRIIYQWEQGRWNEWHLIFSDGISGWLSDAQLEYAISFLSPQGSLPPVNVARVGAEFHWDKIPYYVTSVTQAHYVGVQGELPFEYWDKSEVHFVDLRTTDARFATLDYSEEPPLLFLGYAVEFDDLKLKNLKHFEGWS
ncbi:MAG TPA: DUF4178 domain-containing protein, partial [Bryobacteraceae bacterium]|nr:DUF4178 domain-containing protein [Bryobacteraceae bacterium]